MYVFPIVLKQCDLKDGWSKGQLDAEMSISHTGLLGFDSQLQVLTLAFLM